MDFRGQMSSQIGHTIAKKTYIGVMFFHIYSLRSTLLCGFDPRRPGCWYCYQKSKWPLCIFMSSFIKRANLGGWSDILARLHSSSSRRTRRNV